MHAMYAYGGQAAVLSWCAAIVCVRPIVCVQPEGNQLCV